MFKYIKYNYPVIISIKFYLFRKIYNFIRFIDEAECEDEENNLNNNKKDYNELYNFIDIIHINSIVDNEKFKNINDDNINLIHFLDSFESYIKKIITIHDFQWLFPEQLN